MINHLAIIMDGNRRWAKARFLPAIFWHKAGFDTLKKITRLASNKGIKYLTVWALSTENLQKRGEEEIAWIIKLINHSVKLLPEFQENNVKIQVIGDIEKLPQDSQDILARLQKETETHAGIVLTVALVYGGQNEIVRATKKILTLWVDPETLTEQEFRKYLDSSILPEPEVIVRTGGDIRHSGFLLYDSAYSEYYFTEKKWPEFDEAELDIVIDAFEKSKRNFGK